MDGFEPTYKGLKRSPRVTALASDPCFEPTYKGLKR